MQIDADEVELHPVRRLALGVQDFFHQDIEKQLDSAEETTHTVL